MSLSYARAVRRMDQDIDDHLGDRATLHLPHGVRIPLAVMVSSEEIEVRDGDSYATTTRLYASVREYAIPAHVPQGSQLERVDPFAPPGTEAEWWDIVDMDTDNHSGRRKLILKSARRRVRSSTRQERLAADADSHTDTKPRLRGDR